jgi:hypothetical protein
VLTERRSYSHECPDAIGWYRGGWSILVECKASIGDFYSDKRKQWRQPEAIAMGQERWYLTEPGVLKADLLPDGWGLIEAGARVRRIVDAAHYPSTLSGHGGFRPSRLTPWAPERMAPEIDLLIGALWRQNNMPQEDNGQPAEAH